MRASLLCLSTALWVARFSAVLTRFLDLAVLTLDPAVLALALGACWAGLTGAWIWCWAGWVAATLAELMKACWWAAESVVNESVGEGVMRLVGEDMDEVGDECWSVCRDMGASARWGDCGQTAGGGVRVGADGRLNGRRYESVWVTRRTSLG